MWTSVSLWFKEAHVPALPRMSRSVMPEDNGGRLSGSRHSGSVDESSSAPSHPSLPPVPSSRDRRSSLPAGEILPPILAPRASSYSSSSHPLARASSSNALPLPPPEVPGEGGDQARRMPDR